MQESNQGPAVPESRGFIFHWVANVFFASLALLGLILFGERIPKDMFSAVFTGVVIIGLAMVPLTMRWEKMGIERRRRATEGDPGPDETDAEDQDKDTSGPP